MRKRMSHLVIITVLLAFGSHACQSHQEGHSPATPGLEQAASSQERARCPVCNMYADMDPVWVAQIDYADGSKLMFDTPHHLFKCYFNPTDAEASEYQRTNQNMSKLSVTDYKTKSVIDARAAFYLSGSDIKSIMGDTVVPFASKADAQEAQKQHGGRILAFGEVAPDLLTGLM
jgi:copper chaperone NosL